MYTRHQRFRIHYAFIHPGASNYIGYFMIYMPKWGIYPLCIYRGPTVIGDSVFCRHFAVCIHENQI
jgi:hypothetical protein